MINLEKLSRLAEIAASLAVIITLVVLIVEVRGTTHALEHQSRIDRLDAQFEPFHDSRLLTSAYIKVKEVDGFPPFDIVAQDRYEMTREEAITWGRLLLHVWLGIEADYNYLGPSPALRQQIRMLKLYPDNQIFLESFQFDGEFGEFVASIRNPSEKD